MSGVIAVSSPKDTSSAGREITLKEEKGVCIKNEFVSRTAPCYYTSDCLADRWISEIKIHLSGPPGQEFQYTQSFSSNKISRSPGV